MILPTELTQLIKTHLHEVHQHLGNLPADERQEILQSIESHIYDALEARSEGTPTSALLDAVIAEMDPPESYGERQPTPRKKANRRWPVVLPALILAAATAFTIKELTAPKLTGRWATIDFVSSIDQFSPDTISWTNEFNLTDITLLDDGKTDRPQWTWKNRTLHHSGDNTDAKLTVKKISGQDFLFLKWISRDVTNRELPPKYYVLERSEDEPINGEYDLDCEYRGLRIAEMLKQGAPDIYDDTTAKRVEDEYSKKGVVITINFPDFTKCYFRRGESTPTVKAHKLRKTGRDTYLLVGNNMSGTFEIPFKYDPSEETLTSQTYKYIKRGQPMKSAVIAAALAATNLYAAEFDLQDAIDDARSGATITLPAGTYTEPITVDKPITLEGEQAILKVTGNQAAIHIDTSRPVTLRNLEIQYQTSGGPKKGDLPYAVYSPGGDLLIENCYFKGTSETPCAVLADEESSLTIRSCEFRGFNFTVQISDKSTATIEDSLLINPGHCGITINQATGTLQRNIVTGSRYHAIRCTGGDITATGNLIIKNRNRGFYIGNRSSLATITDNLIVENATGINIYANSKADIENNVIMESSYAGLANQDSADVSAEYNILMNNERGAIGFPAKEGEDSDAELDGANLFFANKTDAESIELSTKSEFDDPQFDTPESGLFSAKEKKFGLIDPSAMQTLWNKWKAATVR